MQRFRGQPDRGSDAAGALSFQRSDTCEFCRAIGLSRRVETRQSHCQHSNGQERAEDGICLEPAVKFVRIP